MRGLLVFLALSFALPAAAEPINLQLGRHTQTRVFTYVYKEFRLPPGGGLSYSAVGAIAVIPVTLNPGFGFTVQGGYIAQRAPFNLSLPPLRHGMSARVGFYVNF
jgi:hypothetical protein